MSFFDDRHRILPRIIEALQRLQNDPDQLARERDQLYSESPPPYQSSGETTQPDSPAEPHVIDESTLQVRRYEASLGQSIPCAQFHAQARRESERIIHQWREERFGRRQTLPFDETQDFRANAENNVRARWIEQGIWKEKWGPPWGKGSKASSIGNLRRRPRIDGLARWGHEKDVEERLPPEKPALESRPRPAPVVNGFTFKFPTNPTTNPTTTTAEPTAPTKQVSTDPLTYWEPDSQPESETESVPDDAPIPDPGEPTKSIFPGWKEMIIRGRAERKKWKAEKRKLRAERRENRRKEAAAAAAAYRLKPEASRPYHQFLYQISKEREWIKDELLYKQSTGFIDIDAMAYEAVKKHWMEDKIWNPQWGELPGMTWMHADLYDKQPETPDGAKEGRRKSPSPPNVVSNGAQRLHLPNSQPLNTEATPGVDIDHTDDNGLPSAPAYVDARSAEASRLSGVRNRTESTRRFPMVPESPRSADKTAGQVLRGVRSSKVKKPSKVNSTTKSGRMQNHRSVGPAKTSSLPRQHGPLLTPQNSNENLSSEQATPGRPASSKRSSRGRADSMASTLKSNPEGQRKTRGRTESVTFEQSLLGTLNGPGRPNRPAAWFQPAVPASGPRRSARIAELQHRK